MTLDEGTFQLYNRIDAPLDAGNWRLTVEQNLSANKDGETLDSGDLGVEDGQAHFTVRSPRFVLPPDQVLSTFPPANSEGSFGSRLPQVVIKRRTLPWERTVGNDGDMVDDPPWLALVLIAEGEGEFVANASTADCFTPGLNLPNGDAEPPEVPVGNYLKIRQSMVHSIFPTQQDVELLAHARAVDINDTELMMGDDDGYLSVVVCNRLPMGGKNDEGDEVPVKYLACLINLEGQYTRLLDRSPDPVDITTLVQVGLTNYAHYAATDHARMGTVEAEVQASTPLVINPDAVRPGVADAEIGTAASVAHTASYDLTQATNESGATYLSEWVDGETATEHQDIYNRMANPWTHDIAPYVDEFLDPPLHFPVLLHWSFTSHGNTTFKFLMKNLSSGLLGDVDPKRAEAVQGRPPLEVVETGHVGLPHATREGDNITSWYRGPLLPHPPPAATTANRLPLAHSSDQLRMVVPDGREDVSLATAFEIGRLLALSRPSIVAALMRWRAERFAVARRQNLLNEVKDLYLDLLGRPLDVELADPFDYELVYELMNGVGTRPEAVFGQPRPLVTPGRPLDFEADPAEILEGALGIEQGTLTQATGSLADVLATNRPEINEFKLDDLGTTVIREQLHLGLDERAVDLAVDVHDIELVDPRITNPVTPGVRPGTLVPGEHFRFRDRLGRLNRNFNNNFGRDLNPNFDGDPTGEDHQ